MRYQPEASVATTPMDDGGLVLLCERSGKLYRCNPTAAVMWTALDQHGGRPDAAAAVVAERYGIDAGRVRDDLDVLVDRLRKAGLIGVGS